MFAKRLLKSSAVLFSAREDVAVDDRSYCVVYGAFLSLSDKKLVSSLFALPWEFTRDISHLQNQLIKALVIKQTKHFFVKDSCRRGFQALIHAAISLSINSALITCFVGQLEETAEVGHRAKYSRNHFRFQDATSKQWPALDLKDFFSVIIKARNCLEVSQ